MQGAFTLHDFGAMGDGSYVHNNGFFFASGGTGLALTAGMAAGRALGNGSRRSAAQAAAVARWKQIDQGALFVSTHGFRMQTQRGMYSWWWDAIGSMQLVAPGTVQFSGDSANGHVTWILGSEWAELVFTFWARVRHRRHPQFLNGGWVPPGWAQRYGASGMSAPGQHTASSQLRGVYAAIDGSRSDSR
ncbi:hypothetical protein SAMN05445060_2016 [Williamsia sterculiae]|uniref:Uncharacterized protein n=1 Tax=Williamsia sterculiae TaxID=1344003 RepID=A0A1N7FFU8_9NOCA|nr:hypothetical protein SAMN05445060_2016 [Williamsia sterculiae]